MAWLFKPDGSINKVQDDLGDRDAKAGQWLYDLAGSDLYIWWFGVVNENGYSHWELPRIEDVPAELKEKLLLLKE